MAEFIDPADLSGFSDDDELMDFLVERVVRPRLAEALGQHVEPEQVAGQVVVFSGCPDMPQRTISTIHDHLQNGMPLAYVLDELIALQVRRQREAAIGALTVHFIELGHQPGEPEPMTVAELRERFAAS